MVYLLGTEHILGWMLPGSVGATLQSFWLFGCCGSGIFTQLLVRRTAAVTEGCVCVSTRNISVGGGSLLSPFSGFVGAGYERRSSWCCRHRIQMWTFLWCPLLGSERFTSHVCKPVPYSARIPCWLLPLGTTHPPHSLGHHGPHHGPLPWTSPRTAGNRFWSKRSDWNHPSPLQVGFLSFSVSFSTRVTFRIFDICLLKEIYWESTFVL